MEQQEWPEETVAYLERRGKYDGSRLQNIPLLVTSRKSECEISQDDKCYYSGFKTRKFHWVKIN
jgi:hypothetical protein